jgi:nitroimidazol reductase NimA-like FMN-containing flavoprotein (pyridoxamine 5'-phosphate oxidase superfamily)
MFMALKKGVPVCVTVTILDGLVSARSPFNSSMNYRSVMIFGTPKELTGEEKERGLYAVTERLIPGLWDAGREQTAKEFAQTMILEISLDDVTAKKRTGGALDPEDAALPIWAGVIPISTVYGNPITNEDAKHVPLPDYVKNIAKRDKN